MDLEGQHLYQKRLFSFLIPKEVPPPTTTYYEEGNLFSKIFFTWVFPILRIGYQRTITKEDLFEITNDLKVEEMYKTFERNLIKRQKGNHSSYSLLFALLETFRYQYALSIICIVLCDAGNSCIPLATRKLIEYVGLKASGVETGIGKGVGYAIGCTASVTVCYILGNLYMYYAGMTGSQAKSILTKFLIKKAFVADDLSKHEYPVSKLTTFMATDLSKIDLAFNLAPFLFSFVPAFAIAVAILAVNIGAPMAVGLGVIILFCIASAILTTLMIKLRIASLVFTDRRVSYIKEVVDNLKIIKLYSWEEPYSENIKKARTQETRRLYKLQFYRNNLIAIAISLSLFASMASFLVLHAIDGDNDPARIFASVSLFGLLGFFIINVPMAVSCVADGIISLKRVSGFLKSGEAEDPEKDSDTESYGLDEKLAIQVVNGEFIWRSFANENNESPKEEGKKESGNAVESEKPEPTNDNRGSKLFKLKDINLTIRKGEFIIVTGMIGSGKSSLLQSIAGFMTKTEGSIDSNGSLLLCGQPWVQNETLRNNIIFGNSFDEDLYKKAIFACELNNDFDTLPAGDNTEVGERGITLSGGQKARVNLCRAVYNNPDIILLDDVLSAVDARVGKHIMDHCITGLLKDKTRILATHQLSFLDYADRIVFLNEDGTIQVGTVDELQNNEQFVNLMSHNSKAISNEEAEELDSDEIEEIEVEQTTKSEAKDLVDGKLVEEENRAINSITWDIYHKYLMLGSKPFPVPIFLLLILLTISLSTFTQLFTNVWLSFWTESKFDKSDNFYIAIYVVVTVMSLVLLILQFLCYIHLTNLASRNLNLKAINMLLGAPMSYLDVTPIGRILNRFTKDTDALDNEIVEQVRLFAFSLANIVGTLILCVIYIPWFAIAIPIMTLIFLFVGSYYQASSREIKRLEAVQRSLVHNNFNESLTGMDTIKAYNDVDRFIQKNDFLIDRMNEANFLVNAIQRWLGTQLNLISFGIVLIISLLCVFRVFNISAASVGLLITYTFGLPNMLVLIVKSYTQLENEMNSVERMCEFAFEIPQEAAYRINETRPNNWPSRGNIEFHNVKMRYRSNLPLTLKDISFSVKGGEKIGIVGRTGAGKTSLTAVLYRLVEFEGDIMIDDVRISDLGLNDLRSKLSIIPQESILFRGTIRRNLDPFDEKTDDELWKALITSGLVDQRVGTDHKFHLDASVEDNGSNFSLGEKQLIAFCRALIRQSKILVLDEATSSVDYKTDKFIQDTLKTEFNDVTVLCIAHRLTTILKYDKILVMDDGNVAEFDTPINLFRNKSSIFRQLCERAKITSQDF
ncbi:oligomycin resistance ATP-dependent permease Yor1p [[Candida] jaroonii]|uniref:Oligomycin resistance ATP-dependent permease Yor1p n=1 Tax=[Candida] jaroonii TaxID=467808 RepID=A0ACA9XZW8_9ASCO|nr:oligomycin resistance ATP-dependent permease Yor1p [[Candida] jaroonii]